MEVVAGIEMEEEEEEEGRMTPAMFSRDGRSPPQQTWFWMGVVVASALVLPTETRMKIHIILGLCTHSPWHALEINTLWKLMTFWVCAKIT